MSVDIGPDGTGSLVATAASSSLPAVPDWHAFSTTIGTLASAST